jgi:outer membrane protein assembly factor BamA
MRGLYSIAFFLILSLTCFSQDEEVVVSDVQILGNERTKEHIILREIPFENGMSIGSGELDSLIGLGKKNLFNTGLFNWVDIEKSINGANAEISVSVVERWYIWPVPILELADPNFNLWWETKDFSRLNYGIILHDRNFRGRDQDLFVKAKTGYTNEFKLTFHNPYINRGMTIGAFLSGHYQENHEVHYNLEDNKRRFYSENGTNARIVRGFEGGIIHRPAIYQSSGIVLSWESVSISDSLATLNNDYLGNSGTNLKVWRPSFFFSLDKRDVRFYALNGYALDVFLSSSSGKKGAGISTNRIRSKFRYYEPLGKRLYASASVHGGMSFVNSSLYLMQWSLGYIDHVRGYESFIIPMDHFGIVKSNLKLALLPQRNIDLRFGPSKFRYSFLAIYLNAYADLGYTWFKSGSTSSPLSNDWLSGGGIGLDFVTYYDKVLRIEFSINQMRNTGLFIHFSQPI